MEKTKAKLESDGFNSIVETTGMTGPNGTYGGDAGHGGYAKWTIDFTDSFSLELYKGKEKIYDSIDDDFEPITLKVSGDWEYESFIENLEFVLEHLKSRLPKN